jgi:hypothetical protein
LGQIVGYDTTERFVASTALTAPHGHTLTGSNEADTSLFPPNFGENTTDFHTSKDEGHLHHAELADLAAMARSIFHQVGATEVAQPELTRLRENEGSGIGRPRAVDQAELAADVARCVEEFELGHASSSIFPSAFPFAGFGALINHRGLAAQPGHPR